MNLSNVYDATSVVHNISGRIETRNASPNPISERAVIKKYWIRELTDDTAIVMRTLDESMPG